MAGSPYVTLAFSEQVNKADAESGTLYSLSPAVKVKSASVAPDAKTVTLQLESPLESGVAYMLMTNGIHDVSPNANAGTAVVTLSMARQVLAFAKPTMGMRQQTSMLPTGATAPWTINLFVYLDHPAKDLSVLAGFGNARDDAGAERFLIERNGHVYFWGSQIDIDSGVPYDLHRWQMITATYDGSTIRVYKDGKQIAEDGANFADAAQEASVAPPSPWSYGHQFDGKVEGLTIWDQALPDVFIEELKKQAPSS
jgi:alpha-mannosidase